VSVPRLNRVGILDDGVYECTLDELKIAFGKGNPHPRRGELFIELVGVINDVLKPVGLKRIYVDGSYTTDKEAPNDIDVAWSVHDIESETPVESALHILSMYAECRDKHGIDLLAFGHSGGFSSLLTGLKAETAVQRGLPPGTRKGILEVWL